MVHRRIGYIGVEPEERFISFSLYTIPVRGCPADPESHDPRRPSKAIIAACGKEAQNSLFE
jgi:hypothetical protein